MRLFIPMYYVGRIGDMLFVTASGSGDVHVLIHCGGSSHSMTTVLHAGLPGGGILISCSAVGNLLCTWSDMRLQPGPARNALCTIARHAHVGMYSTLE